MAKILHGSARTTPRVRAELQASKESSRALAAWYGLHPKAIAEWRGRAIKTDVPMGLKKPKGTVLTPAEEAIVVRVPASDAAAAERCPGLPTRRHPEPQPLRPVSVPATAQHLPSSGSRDRADAQAFQDLRDQLRAYPTQRILRSDFSFSKPAKVVQKGGEIALEPAGDEPAPRPPLIFSSTSRKPSPHSGFPNVESSSQRRDTVA